MKHLRKLLPAIFLTIAVLAIVCVKLGSPKDVEVPKQDNPPATVVTASGPVVSNTDAQDKNTAETPTTPDSADKPAANETKAPEKEPEKEADTSSTSIKAVGIVDGDVNLRKKAGTDSEVLEMLSDGTAVSILSKQDGWYKVSYGGKTGYMSADYLTSKTSASGLKGYAKVTTDALNMRNSANTSGDVVAMVAQGEYVKLSGFENGWYKVSYGDYSGYMSGDYLSLVAEKPEPPKSTGTSSSGSKKSISSSSSLPSGQSAGNGSGTGSDIVDYALSFCGVTYSYGGASPSGFDCSGFTMYVYDHFGYDLPHGATTQMNYGQPVSRDNLSPGDLVFFFDSDFADSGASHVGIYIGGGQIVHASSGPGYCVKVSSFRGDGSTGNYYSEVYLTARHIAG